MMGDTPILMINEPILVSSGVNSDLRYDFYYPRWAYDPYRERMSAYARANNLNYLDAWDLVKEKEFTNSAIHLTPQGSKELANFIASYIESVLVDI